MVAGCEQGWRVRVRVVGAQAVHLLGRFNNWSTVATPMQRGPGDAWETVLPATVECDDLRCFVWRPGEIYGHLHHEH